MNPSHSQAYHLSTGGGEMKLLSSTTSESKPPLKSLTLNLNLISNTRTGTRSAPSALVMSNLGKDAILLPIPITGVCPHHDEIRTSKDDIWIGTQESYPSSSENFLRISSTSAPLNNSMDTPSSPSSGMMNGLSGKQQSEEVKRRRPSISDRVKEKVRGKRQASEPNSPSISPTSSPTQQQHHHHHHHQHHHHHHFLDSLSFKDASRLRQYQGVLTKVSKGVYVGDIQAAQDLNALKEAGITHILNVAGDTVPNFYPSEFQYKKVVLRDHPTENVFCLFYDILEFLENALLSYSSPSSISPTARIINNLNAFHGKTVNFSNLSLRLPNNSSSQQKTPGKVLIHCVQGISRSTTMAICYLMYKHNCSYEQALQRIKHARPIAEPNAGYVLSLMNWDRHRKSPFASDQIRIYRIHRAESNQRSGNVSPVSPSSSSGTIEDILTSWTKLLHAPSSYSENVPSSHQCHTPLLETSTFRQIFKSDACVLVHTPSILYIWIGKQSQSCLRDAALRLAQLLHKYEEAEQLEIVLDEEEPERFSFVVGMFCRYLHI